MERCIQQELNMCRSMSQGAWGCRSLEFKGLEILGFLVRVLGLKFRAASGLRVARIRCVSIAF